jgi:hypothetical protein
MRTDQAGCLTLRFACALFFVLCSNYVFEYLDIEAREMQQMNLQLGFPAHVVHIIKPGSPLFNLSLQVCYKFQVSART